MISKAAVESAAEAAAPGSKEGAWKWAIRKKVRCHLPDNGWVFAGKLLHSARHA